MNPLFEVREPPAGGARALRQRIALERRRQRRLRRTAAIGGAASLAALAIVAMLAAPRTSPRPAVADLDLDLVRMRLGTRPLPEETVTVAANSRVHTATLRLTSTDDRVVLYRVASNAPDEPAIGLDSSPLDADESR